MYGALMLTGSIPVSNARRCRRVIPDPSSLSPMRGDVKERISLRPLQEEMDVAICIQPDLRSGEALCSRHASHRPRQSTISIRRFHSSMVRRLRSGSYASKPGVALIRQPWSYLRLEAYSFFRLCEGV